MRSRQPTQPRRLMAVAGVGAMVLVAGASTGAAAESAPEEACSVVAAVRGLNVMVTADNNVLLAAPTGVAVPAVEACVDHGLGESRSFASSPYPGENGHSLSNLVLSSIRNETGTPVPNYPAYASSSYPSKKDETIGQPGLSLGASSTETSSQARGVLRPAEDAAAAISSVATAESVTDPRTGSSGAIATSDTSPLVINDVLRLGQVHSAARAKVGRDGEVVRTSELWIGRTEVAGQVVEITPEGVHAAGQNAPLPQDDPAAALKAAGVEVRYLAEEKTARGVLCAGIEVTAQQRVDSGVVTVRYTFGRAFAAAAVEDRSGAGDGVGGFEGSVSGVGSAGTGDSGASPAGGLGVGSAPTAPEVADAAPAQAPATAPPPVVAAAGWLASTPGDMGLAGTYLVMVFGALAMFVGGTLLRLLGVKTRWTS
jgi:hypothetical protein